MKRPWWREANQTWYVTLPGGKQEPLGKDPLGGSRKNPPKEIEDAWHRLEQAAGKVRPKAMPYRAVADLYVESLRHPKTRKETRRQLDGFVAFVGDIKVAEL